MNATLRRAFLALVLLLSLLLPSAVAQPRYRLVNLGTFAGGKQSRANAINNAGHVVGVSDDGDNAERAFLYTGSGLHNLGSLSNSASYAYGINSLGSIIGDSGTRAFLYGNGTMTSLGALAGTSGARGINDAGQIVGGGEDSLGRYRALLYSGGSIVSLGTLGGVTSVARGINSSGQIIGDSDTLGGQVHAFRYSNGSMSDLGTLGGIESHAYAINASGQIVGGARTASGEFHAFLHNNGSMADLGILPGRPFSYAQGLNDVGHVVGYSTTTASDLHLNARAFLYRDGTMYDLNELLDSSGVGWTVFLALGINSSGQIAGWGLFNGEYRAVRLDPIECSYNLSATSVTTLAVGGNGTVNVTASVSSCQWAASSPVPWVTITSGTNSTGNGTVRYTVQANTATTPRSTNLTIAGQSFMINQSAADCAFSLTATSVNVGANGSATIPVFVTTNGSNCAGTASSNSPWLSVIPAAFSGNSIIIVAAVQNTTATARTGMVTIAGLVFTVNQAANCFFTFSPGNALDVQSGGGSVSVNVTASQAACGWTANSPVSWVLITSGATGTGNGTATFTVQPNTSSSARTAVLIIGGLQFRIDQAGVGCTFQLDPSGASISAAGGPVSVSVTASSPTCSWAVVSNAYWLSITSGATGSGSGTVTLQVEPNTADSPRPSTLGIAGLAFRLNQLGVQLNGPLRFVSIAPCRLMETRPEYNFEGRTGAFGPPLLTGGLTRTLTLANSNVCTVPASAKAYVLNVTAIPRGQLGFVTVYPAFTPRPNFFSVRSLDGQIVANSAIVAASSGAISVYSSNDTDMLIDISGYFTDAIPGGTNLAYYPLTPCRVIETRTDYRPQVGQFGPPSMAAGTTRRFRFPQSPHCSVPSGASAYSATLTVVPPASLAYMTLWPASGSQPNVSSINSFAGRILANNVIIPASADGSIDVFASNQTDFLVDINGYFAPDDGTGLYYFPVTQCRAQDSTFYADDSTRTINVPTAGNCTGIPATAKGYAINLTAMPGGSALPFVTVYPTGQERPNASILNAFEGQIVTGGGIIPAGTNGSIDVYAFRRTYIVVDVSGYFGR